MKQAVVEELVVVEVKGEVLTSVEEVKAVVELLVAAVRTC